ncbi:XRE/MutR family transcriptional regulator [Lactovum odontotermitis]
MVIERIYGYTFEKLCKAKEIKNADISRRTGISKSTLSKFINGELSLKMDQMAAALEAIHVDLAEFGLYVNNYRYNYYERYFKKIEQGMLSDNRAALEKTYDEAVQKGERMIALSAKAHINGLEEAEITEISSFTLGVAIFTFYELAILSSTITEFSPHLIRGTIQDLQKRHKNHGKHMLYRGLVCQIACRAAMACVKHGQSVQREAAEALALAEKYCHEKDIYSRQLYLFAKGYYELVHGTGSEHKHGLEEMKNVIQVFEWSGSKQLARFYQKKYGPNFERYEKKFLTETFFGV